MATVKPSYAASANFTITLASLANSSGGNVGRVATAIDNSTNLYDDADVSGFIKTGASGVSATGAVYLYVVASIDGTNYTENASATDAAITMTSPPNAFLLGIINAVANATTYKFGPFSVAGAINGVLPQKWSLVAVNSSGAALDATAGNHQLSYQGIQYTVV